MACQQCGKNATVHVTDVQEGRPRTRRFCSDHAREHLRGEELRGEPLGLTESDTEKGAVSVPLPGGGKKQLSIPVRSQVHDLVRVVSYLGTGPARD